jgi:hypothetical protein
VALALVPVLGAALAAVVLVASRGHGALTPVPAPGAEIQRSTSVPGNVKGRLDAPVEIEEWGDFQ